MQRSTKAEINDAWVGSGEKKEIPSHQTLNATGIEPVTIWISVTDC
jgi:hypothetical protein